MQPTWLASSIAKNCFMQPTKHDPALYQIL
jgi:hypothetical protein